MASRGFASSIQFGADLPNCALTLRYVHVPKATVTPGASQRDGRVEWKRMAATDRDLVQNQPPAVLLGLDSYIGLQTARILSQRRVHVIGVASDPKSAYCRSRSVAAVVRAEPDAGSIGELVRLGASFDAKPVLIPCSDDWVLVASRDRAQLLPHFQLVLPEADSVERLMDKSLFYAFAGERQFPVVPFETVRDLRDVERAAELLGFPVIVKPTHRSSSFAQCAGEKAVRVDTAEELLALVERCGATVPELVVQQWIEGGDSDLIACNLYVDRQGEIQVTFVTRKIRQYPPLTGQACLAEEAADSELLALTISLFREAGLIGLGYLEWKRDARNGRPFIIEPTVGRPPGRVPITEAAGVEFLYTVYCDAAGLPLPDDRIQLHGDAKWIYLTRDIASAWHYFRRGELTLREWLRSVRGPKYYAVFSWSDPVPFFLDIPQSIRRGFRLKREARRVPAG